MARKRRRISPRKAAADAEAAAAAAEPAEGCSCEDVLAYVSKQLGDTAHGETLIDMDEPLESVKSLFEAVIHHQESHSMLVSGPPGSGKTAVVEKALQSVRAAGHHVVRVRLSGLVHTEDKTALRDLTWQLCVDSVVEERTEGAQSFLDHLRFLVKVMRQTKREHIPVVFELDHFELFALHAKQTLLYALFDMMQSADASMLVIGLTSRMDAVELLEKRVRSRFSHRHVTLRLVRDVDKQVALLASRVLIAADEAARLGPRAVAWNESARAVLRGAATRTVLTSMAALQSSAWDLLRLARGAVVCVAMRRDAAQPALCDADVQRAYDEFVAADQSVQIVQGLSMLQWCLLYAALRLERKGLPSYNAEHLHAEYKTLGQHQYSRAVAMKAFEHMVELGLFEYPGRSRTTRTEFRAMRLTMTRAHVDACLDACNVSPVIRQWGKAWLQ